MEALVQSLPIEIREKIYKYVVAAKINERDDLGWDCVHEEIRSAPFCVIHKRIVKITACYKCNRCDRIDWCYTCYKNGNKHFLGYPIYDTEDLDFIFKKYI